MSPHGCKRFYFFYDFFQCSCYSPLLFAAADSDAGFAVAIRSSPPTTAFKPGRQMQRLTERLLEEFARISLEQFLIRDAVASTATIHFTT